MAYGSTWYMLPNLIIELKKYAFVQWIDITTSRSYMLSISVICFCDKVPEKSFRQ